MTFPATDAAVHVRAPGKINLFMRVGAAGDDGYHDVATAYQAVSLYEDVRAWSDDEFSVAFSGSVDTAHLPTDASNLAIRAAKLLARHAGVPGGVRLEIEKHVPIAGGMGGGSADAAATLVACDALWGTALPKEELHALAASLGADVPFALTGGTAIGTGRGDRLSPALATGSFHWVLVVADHGLSTPAVYGELDHRREAGLEPDWRDGRHGVRAGLDSPTVDAAVLQALRAGDPRQLAPALHNDLQSASLALDPGLADVLALGEQQGALAGLVSGSGPTVAMLVDDANAAIELQVALSASGRHALHVHGPVHGARVLAY
ncbi:4-(cytidine 5'-diphospho)-2-C-methyl-D-erythritol kinase [Agromyces marinus]|uniref:4-diphosphocytidyl-2-C-methyl-D-erythritol kinase n=1 Tax=Agromyces marinus TaxID=1389020 RepID=A0ABM8H4T7_9MICO|nr:4-(cytidine 5'-diphospho)-2-C-methyl-D-erythritol kinase [Agromyces marinus]UIP59179.1 4-diphosphocytidyl-2-C-methyl-D-erythritol kinase [Agromyces marinus]BDZ55821.1 4-diphosphocytidyl-2-C-methyl-D-erythritol kinase [Agromyces marinus]